MPPYSQKGYNFDDGTYSIIGACLRVHKELGPGFREIIYQRALALELKASNLDFAREEKNGYLSTIAVGSSASRGLISSLAIL